MSIAIDFMQDFSSYDPASELTGSEIVLLKQNGKTVRTTVGELLSTASGGSGMPYKEITFFFSQAGTDDPVLSFLCNQTTAEITANRISAGHYQIISNSTVFVDLKTTPGPISGDVLEKHSLMGPDGTNYGSYLFYKVSISKFEILTFDAAGVLTDGILNEGFHCFTIKIYN